MRIVALDKESKQSILNDLLKRSPNNYSQYESTVNQIIEKVRAEGDKALFDYTLQFDKFALSAENIRVTKEEIAEAYAQMDENLIDVIRQSAENIRAFHQKQLRNSWFDAKPDGTILGMKITAIERAGVYVPGGKAAYPSSVLMNVIPAKVAGVDEIIMTTPPGKDGKVNPGTLVAAEYCRRGYHLSRSAVPRLSQPWLSEPSRYLRSTRSPVPVTIFVALAKKAVYGYVSIDSIAGPSEILVLADETATPRYVAADLLSQAEHDELASAILITTSKELAEKVSEEVDGFVKVLERAPIIQKSLDNYGYILLADNMEDAIDAANAIASEHLEIITKNPFDTMTRIRNAGAIFLGEYASEPLGDYFAGPNHILPTNGTARFFSPVNVDDFIKKTSIISYSRQALEKVHNQIETFAKSEGLTAHANSIKVRFED